ncbi:MAG: hypothetical protein ABGX10_02315 [Paracoccus sp. (in: a-proteobacteria)]|uniref:hypothetical protein n=1 Tax=Paracoccus sp. TaxID=267 RepID=UPI0032429EB4
MTPVFRQLAALFIVTLIAMGLGISAGNAGMDLECQMAMSLAQADHHAHPAAGDGGTGAGHAHDAGMSPQGQGSHCQAHLCPATALAGSVNVARALLIGRPLEAVDTVTLPETTVLDGLHRPPRA